LTRGPLPPGSVVVSGRFLNVNEGTQLRRLVIGFGAGKSTLDTQVQFHGMSGGRYQLLQEFATHADSGAMGRVKAHRSSVEEAAARTADQAVAQLSQFFAQQGWIAPGAATLPSR
jgi:hypothetical protein